MRIGMAFDLRSVYLAEGYSEEDVADLDSDVTIAELERAIRAAGHETARIGHARELCRRLLAGERWDLVFSIAEGMVGRGRESLVPCLLEAYGLPYTFSDPLTCAVTLDKAVAKRLALSAGIRTPRFRVVEREADAQPGDLRFPLFAKPIAEGTGKGVDAQSRIDGPDRLAAVCARLLDRFRQPVLVEEYLPGREFTVGVLGTGANARALGAMEVCIRPDAPATDYSYTVKERWKEFVEYVPVGPGPLRREMEDMALRAHRAFECRDASRSDLRLDADGAPSFMEINPLPGLCPGHSDLPIMAEQQGVSYHALIAAILESAIARIPNPAA